MLASVVSGNVRVNAAVEYEVGHAGAWMLVEGAPLIAGANHVACRHAGENLTGGIPVGDAVLAIDDEHGYRAALDDLGKVLLAGAQFGIVADALALIVDAQLQGSGDLRQLSLPGVADIEHLQVIDAGAQKPDGGIDRCACAERYRRRQGGCRDEPRMRLQQALIVFIAQDEQFDFA